MWRRGANLDGDTANFIETEQLLEFEGFKTSFLQVFCYTRESSHDMHAYVIFLSPKLFIVWWLLPNCGSSISL